MPTPSKFTAPWSTSLKLTTVFVLLLLIVINVVAFSSGLTTLTWVIAPGIAVLTLGITGLFAIRGYDVTPTELLIRRPLWTTRIPLAGMTEVIADPKASFGSIRLFGNGGLYCFCGWFWNRRFGMYRVFATDFKNTVVLTIDGKTVLVTPDDPERFISAVRGE